MNMTRKVFDVLASGIGLVLVVVLLIAGGLLTWGSSYASDTVHNQLAAQQIFFPTAAQLAHPTGTEITAAMQGTLGKYAGQQVLTGAQAEDYANHFIAVHLSEMPFGGVYSKVSGASLAAPKNAALAAEVQTVFRGTTLRGLLLEAYGFSMLGTVAFWSAIAAFVLAFILLIASGLGFRHARVTAPEKQLVAQKVAVV
jgi:hypothetical protein